MTLLQTLLEYWWSCRSYWRSLAAVTVVLALRLGGRREEPADDYDTLSASRFTIPVSHRAASSDDSEVASGFSRTLTVAQPQLSGIRSDRRSGGLARGRLERAQR